ncbi:MAG: DUF2442 domain-containing protein [Candidatus Jettenia sp. CY-1]|nr:MAG: DUF2442 domain-containing protein [Candidatus Jettenia sp. CY-1]
MGILRTSYLIIAIIFKIVKMRACPVGVFTELKDKIYFQQVRAVHGTVVWPHEQDICPDTLYIDSIKIKKIPNKSLHWAGTKSIPAAELLCYVAC